MFYQLDNLQLDPLPVFKLSPSVFLNTKFNPRNDDTDRKIIRLSATFWKGLESLHSVTPLENTRNLCTFQKQTPGRLKNSVCAACRAVEQQLKVTSRPCINRKEVLLRHVHPEPLLLGMAIWDGSRSLSIPTAGKGKGFCPCKDENTEKRGGELRGCDFGSSFYRF